MSFPTQQAFIHIGSWDEETRKHPAMNWMEKYTHGVDRKIWNDEPASNHLTSDHELRKSTGEVITGADASFQALREEIYAPMKEHLHDPQFLVAWEDGDHYEMLGVASVYYNLPIDGQGSKANDRNGKEWDGVVQAAFDFRYRKDGDSFKLARTAIYSDPTPALVKMLKGGMMKPEDLLK